MFKRLCFLQSIEKNDVLFILITSPEEDFTFLFTYSPVGSGRVILRQRIRNYGTVTDAKFFIYYDTLYLVITHDNQVHSITMCPYANKCSILSFIALIFRLT